ncbi:MAG: molybdopterin-dependent oxidoreductase [Verrucomicrobiota bacterium]
MNLKLKTAIKTAIRGGTKAKALQNLVRQHEGPLTTRLVREPGAFGLGQVPSRLKPDAVTTSVCGFCATGCGLKLHLRDGQAVNLSADPAYPVNLGMACPKGWEALTPLDADDRGRAPMLDGKPVAWQTAAGTFAARMRHILDAHGPESVAVLSTGQIVTEEMAFLGAFAKFGMGLHHMDSNTRQCMATAAVAYKQSFGFDAPPFTYADFEESDVLVFVGSNPCIAHPIMWQRVMMNRRNPKIIVVDPRRTETAQAATHHCAIKPKSDLILLYGLAQLLIEKGAVKRDFIDAHTSGYDDFAAFVSEFTAARVSRDTGLSEKQLHETAELIANHGRVSFWWTMGVNQGHESTRTAQAIINLALMTGNIGRPGTGANSITGQCNAMGSRLFGNATSLLGGHDANKPADRAKVAGILGIPEGRIPPASTVTYDQIIERVADGRIKGLWILATNPSHSWIDSEACNRALEKLDFLVVQDMYPTTDTARRAHLYLPAAGWGEKDGTFINAERRIGVVKKVRRAPGEALSDFNILRLLAQSWSPETAAMFRDWTSPEAVFGILKQLSAGQPFDFTGIDDYNMLSREGGIQWPWPAPPGSTAFNSTSNPAAPASALDCGDLSPLSPAGLVPRPPSQGDPSPTRTPTADSPDGGKPPFSKAVTSPRTPNDFPGPTEATAEPTPSPPRERRLFTSGRFFHPDGRARFLFEAPRLQPEPTDGQYPICLLTGRGTSAQWHTNTRTGKSAVLRKLHPQNCLVEIHPMDAAVLKIRNQDRVLITSRRATVEATAVLTPCVQPGQCFMPMHYEEVNHLTLAAFDPHSRQPSYKACAVRISGKKG